MASGVRRNIEWCQGMASEHGGLCLSPEYHNNREKLLWRCEKGHEWKTAAGDVQQGTWCLVCSGSARHDVKWLVALAAKRGGTCLSTEYTNNWAKYCWRCKEGHEWEGNASNIQKGEWCLRCSGHFPRDLKWCQDLAAQHHGVCLSQEYSANWVRMEWQCSDGHRWFAAASDIQQGKWCAACCGLAPKNLEWLHSLAVAFGGTTLSTEYINVHTKYRWQCSKGHQWKAEAASVQQGHWCASCSGRNSKKEKKVLAHIKAMFPDAVGNKRGLLKTSQLELDIYIPSLKCAVEFDGTYWHSSDKVKERDARKNQQCIEAGIKLLRVPERNFDSDPTAIFKQIEDFLMFDIVTLEYLGEGK